MAGISASENKSKVINWFKKLGIYRVLDVGAGFGVWSILLRTPKQHWTALEVFYPYAKMFDLREKYNDIYIADARYVDFNKIGQWWDLSILADVLEHMHKDEAKDVITELLPRSRYILISIPIEHNAQHAGDEGNDFETHIDHWTAKEMDEFLGVFKGTHRVAKRLVGKVLAYYLVELL